MVWNFLLYLLYGLAFFTLGVAILSRDIRLSELGIARIIWLLAVFGIIHGFHEWLELLEQLYPEINTRWFSLFRLLVVGISFLFLLYFGIFINIISTMGDKSLQSTPLLYKSLVAAVALALIIIAILSDIGSGQDINVRRFVAFPGGLLSGVGLMLYSRKVRSFSPNVAKNFILAGGFMCSYAVLSGLVPSDAMVPLLNVQVILLRGASAFGIMFFTIRGMSVFSLEQRELIDEKLQRFSQSEKLTSMGILAAGIAHEINNPLTNVSLNVEMLKDIVGNHEKGRKKLDAIERNLERASRIAKELLHFSREKETTLEPVDINDVIHGVLTLVRSQPRSSIIRLELQEVPFIPGIAWKLEEVFLNILMNSFDACSDEDYIEVKTFSKEQNVVVEITDSGKGIQNKNISKIFDPFFTTKDVGKGTGLGLSVCYNIIKQHGGDISLVSSDHGGTIVTVTFPEIENGHRYNLRH